MKTLLLLILTLLTLTGCGSRENCYVYVEAFRADSVSLQARRTWITETVRAASEHMSAGDYEDVYKTVEKSVEVSKQLFPDTLRYTGLVFVKGERQYKSVEDMIQPKSMNASVAKVYDSLSRHTTATRIDGWQISCEDVRK